MSEKSKHEKPYGNPYIAGVFLGLTLLASFLLLGSGLGASSGIARIGAFLEGLFFPTHTLSGEYFGRWGDAPLRYYLVFMMLGAFLGGFFSAITNSRVQRIVEKGASAKTGLRLLMAAAGGVLVGFASRLAGGCTSGQALTGGALLLTGSLIFLCCLFLGGYAASPFVRRQWHD